MLCAFSLFGIDLDAHGVLLGAEHVDLRHAVRPSRCAAPGCSPRSRRAAAIVHAARREVEHQDRPVGRILLAERRRRRQRRRQERHGRRDGRLDVDDRAVDVAVEVERQRDVLLPAPLDEVISSTPAMVVNCRSSGLATVEAMVCGSPPGSVAPTFTVG